MKYFTVYVGSPQVEPDEEMTDVMDVMGLHGTGIKHLGKLYVRQDNSACAFMRLNARKRTQAFCTIFDALYWLKNTYVGTEKEL